MTMTIEKKLRDFHFWSGAATNAAKLSYEELDRLEEQLESMIGSDEPWSTTVEEQLEEIIGDDEPWSTTQVNDLMWFQFEDVCEWLGLDWEEVMARKDRWEE